jgi:Putative Flp pilus-assembly TadE/G-like
MLRFVRHRYGAPSSTSQPSGQVLLIFAVAFAVIIMMLALLFDGARGLVMRRQMQDASDAAALAGANVVQAISPHGCSATAGPPPGAAQAAVVAAAKASVATNLPSYNPNDVQVTCLDGWSNSAVQVQLGQNSETFFGSIFGGGPLSVRTSSVAVNGQTTIPAYSVVLLNPSHPAWNKGNGCPSFGINGGITATFDSTIYIDSSCTAANGGGFAAKGGSASLTFGAGGGMRIVGEYKPQSLTVTPAPLEHQTPPKPDPLAFLTAPPVANMTVKSTSKLVLNNTTMVLDPGVYVGGIQLKNSSEVYLRPGVYVMKDGGLDLGAQAKLYSVAAGKTTASAATWATTDCPSSSCGVLIYKTTVSSTDQITVSAGATWMTRAFLPEADTTAVSAGGYLDKESYRNLLIWQDASPVPSSSYAQPSIQLQGGGTAVLSGGVYAPSASVDMGGSPGGSGGSVDLTLQFITWDLNLSGNASFHFVYRDDAFPKPLDYGLIQ